MSHNPREAGVVRLISLFYLLMAAAGLGLIWWRRDVFPAEALALPGEFRATAFLLTAGITIVVHLLSRLAHARLPGLRHGARDIQRLLGNLTPAQIAAVALASGIGEEMLFRGWLMNETNLWISSLVFGLIHIPPNRQWLYWPFFAFLMGLVLGWLYVWSGSLLFPVLLHAGVNFLNLRLLLGREGAEKAQKLKG